MTAKNDINPHFNTIMEMIDWPDDAFVPVANEENRKLMEHLQQLIETKENQGKHLKELDQRVKLLTDHYQNAQSDMLQNLKLLDAHRQQRTAEHHLLKLAENEQCTIRQLRKDEEIEIVAFAQQNISIEEHMQRLNEKIDTFGSDMQWMKSALIEWTQAIEQDERTNELVKKFCMEDEKRANALEVQRQAIQKNISKHRQQLERLVAERMSMGQVLDRTNNLYGKLHVERKNMIDTWRAAVQTLNARDKAIQQTIKEISASNKQVKGLKIELDQHKAIINEQLLTNKEIQYEITQLNEESGKVRQQLNDSMKSMQLSINEVITLKRELRNKTNCLQQIRQNNRQINIDSEKLTKTVGKLKASVDDLTAKLNVIELERNNADSRLKHLSELFESEERSVDAVQLEIARITQLLYRTTQILQQERNEYKLIESEICSLETTVRATSSNFLSQEKELARQMEIQYDIHFRTVRLEYRIAKMQGAIDEVDPKLLEKCACLEQICEATHDKSDHVKKQLAIARETQRRLQNSLLKSQSEHETLIEKVQNNGADCDNGARTITKNRDNLHEHLVERSLLEMRIDQMTKMFNRQVGKFFDLGQQKIQLQAAIDERLLELKYQHDILLLRRKHMHSERDVLRADINERNAKIAALKVRFEMCHQLLGKNEDGSTVSVIQLRMETMQEKALLLDRGSKLNEKVLKAESDIKALENTLMLLNYSNDKYKQKVKSPQDNDEINEKIHKLNNDYGNGLARLRKHRNDLQLKTKHLEEMEEQLILYERDMEEIIRNRHESSDSLLKIHRELVDQNAKLERAKRELRQAKKAMVRRIQNRDYVRIFEKTLKSKEIEIRNCGALQQLADMVDSVSGIGLIVPRLLYKKGLEIPISTQFTICKPTSRARSRLSRGSTEAESECNMQSPSDDGLLSKLSERTFVSTSTNITREGRSSVKSMISSRHYRLPSNSTCNIQIEGQSICSDKTAST